MGILDVKELAAGVMKSSRKMEHPFDRIFIASGGLKFLCL